MIKDLYDRSKAHIENTALQILTSPSFPRSEALRLDELVRNSSLSPSQVLELEYRDVAKHIAKAHYDAVIEKIKNMAENRRPTMPNSDFEYIIGAESSPILAGFTIRNPIFAFRDPNYSLAENTNLAKFYKTRVLEELESLK